MNLFYGIYFLLFVVVNAGEDDSFHCPFEFGVFPHEIYCDKFWECDNHTATLMLCGNGLAFQDDDETFSNTQCNWRHLVHCGKRKLFQDPVAGYPGCPLLYGLWPHKKFCNGFKKCWDGSQSFQRCENLDHVVDPVKMECVDASKVPSCNKIEGEWIREPYECPQENGLFPHHLFCDRYWECHNRIPREHFCLNGLVYDPLHKKKGNDPCTMPRDVDCSKRGLMAEPIPSDDSRCPRLNGFFPHTRKCNVYWECRNGKPIRGHCTKKLNVYNPRTKKCDTPDQVPECQTPTMTWETFDCPIEDGYFPHKRSCDKYWKCRQGKSKLYTCPNGKIFDSSYSATSFLSENNSNDSNTTTAPNIESTTSTFIDESTTIGVQQTLGNDINTLPIHSKMRRTIDPCVNIGFADCGARDELEPPISTPNCPRLNGIFIHNTFRDRYYNCNDGLAIEMKCPKNSNIFNPYEKACQKLSLPPRPIKGCKHRLSKNSLTDVHMKLYTWGIDCLEKSW